MAVSIPKGVCCGPTASRFAEHPCGGAAWSAKASIAPNSTPGWPGSVENPRSDCEASRREAEGLYRVVRRSPGGSTWPGDSDHGHRKMRTAMRMMASRTTPTAPWPSIFCSWPFQQREKSTADTTADATTGARHQGWLERSPAAPAMRPAATTTQKTLTRLRVPLSPKDLESAHEPTGQIMPGFSSKILALCAK